MKTLNNTDNTACAERLRRQRGLSLMEMGIAATVLAALILGALLALNKLQFERRLSEARKEIPVTITTAIEAITTQPDTEDLNTAAKATRVLSTFNVWPQNRVQNPGMLTVQVNGHFPGSIEQMVTNTGTHPPRLAPNQGFAYWIRNIPPEACMPLVQLLVAQPTVVQVYVTLATTATNGRPGTAELATYKNGAMSMNAETAATACAGKTNKNVVAMIGRQ